MKEMKMPDMDNDRICKTQKMIKNTHLNMRERKMYPENNRKITKRKFHKKHNQKMKE